MTILFYCVNDNLLHSDLQTSGKFTSVKNTLYPQQSRLPVNMNFQDIFWSLKKVIRGTKTNDTQGILDLNIPIHQVKGYYQGVDNPNRPVYFEVYMNSITSNSQNKQKLYMSVRKRHIRLTKTLHDDIESQAPVSQADDPLYDANTIHAVNPSRSNTENRPPSTSVPPRPEHGAKLSDGGDPGRPVV